MPERAHDPIRIGLVGAGPWAAGFHAPMIARAEGLALTAVWARRPAAAEALAQAHGASVAQSYEHLINHVDAVAFAVPPDVQARLAPQAAEAGKHLILDKPLAFDLEDAEALATAVHEAQVASILMLRTRFDPAVLELLAQTREARPRAVIARCLTDAALPPNAFATPWRIERGALLDLAPHTLDLTEAILGPTETIAAAGDPTRGITITTTHADNAVATMTFSLTTPGDDGFHLSVAHEQGVLHLGPLDEDFTTSQDALMARFVEAVRTGAPHDLDVHRGLELQRVLDQATR